MILTSSQLNVLRAIESHHAEHGAYPSYEVLAKSRGRSMVGTRAKVNELDNRGCLTRSPQLRSQGARRILSVDISAAKCRTAKRVKRAAVSPTVPRRMSEQCRQGPVIDGSAICSQCRRKTRASDVWWHGGTKTCDGCYAAPPPPKRFSKQADRAEELRALSELALSHRWA